MKLESTDLEEQGRVLSKLHSSKHSLQSHITSAWYELCFKLYIVFLPFLQDCRFRTIAPSLSSSVQHLQLEYELMFSQR
jgi:hypothetical protein